MARDPLRPLSTSDGALPKNLYVTERRGVPCAFCGAAETVVIEPTLCDVHEELDDACQECRDAVCVKCAWGYWCAEECNDADAQGPQRDEGPCALLCYICARTPPPGGDGAGFCVLDDHIAEPWRQCYKCKGYLTNCDVEESRYSGYCEDCADSLTEDECQCRNCGRTGHPQRFVRCNLCELRGCGGCYVIRDISVHCRGCDAVLRRHHERRHSRRLRGLRP